MKVFHALFFTLVVIFKSIVCPNSVLKLLKDDPPLRVVRMPAAELSGVWTLFGKNYGYRTPMRHPIERYLEYVDVVIKGKTIIGRDENHELYPLYSFNEDGCDFITMQFGHPPHALQIYYHTFGTAMFEPLPENTIYEPPLLRNRSRSPPKLRKSNQVTANN